MDVQQQEQQQGTIISSSSSSPSPTPKYHECNTCKESYNNHRILLRTKHVSDLERDYLPVGWFCVWCKEFELDEAAYKKLQYVAGAGVYIPFHKNKIKRPHTSKEEDKQIQMTRTKDNQRVKVLLDQMNKSAASSDNNNNNDPQARLEQMRKQLEDAKLI